MKVFAFALVIVQLGTGAVLDRQVFYVAQNCTDARKEMLAYWEDTTPSNTAGRERLIGAYCLPQFADKIR